MNKYLISILAMSALMMVACSKETPETDQIPEEEPGIEYEFTATLDDQEPETEASIDFTSTGKVSWVSTDKIAVWTGSSFVEFTAKSISPDGYTATFSATVSGTPSFGKAYYPASIAGASEHQVILPSSYSTADAAADGFPMMSDTVIPGQPVTFKHLGSFLKLTLTGLPAGSDNLTVTASGASLAGTFTASFNGGAPTLTATSGTASLTVPATSGDNTVYLPVPAGTYGFEIVVKNSSGRNLFRKSASSRTFSRATLKSLKPLAYVAPSRYYVTTESDDTQYDVTFAPLIHSGSDYYEAQMNCGRNATIKIFDEYNLDNANGFYSPAGNVNDANLYKIYYNASNGTHGPEYKRGLLSDPWGFQYFSTFTMSIVGQISSWDDDIALTYNGNLIWYNDNITIAADGDYYFKFRESGSWNNGWGSNVYQTTYGDAWANNNADIKASLNAGTYSLYVNATWDTNAQNQDHKQLKYSFHKH